MDKVEKFWEDRRKNHKDLHDSIAKDQKKTSSKAKALKKMK